MLMVNLAIISTALLAIVALLYWYLKKQSRINKEKKIQEIVEQIKSLKGEIYSSVFEYETIGYDYVKDTVNGGSLWRKRKR